MQQYCTPKTVVPISYLTKLKTPASGYVLKNIVSDCGRIKPELHSCLYSLSLIVSDNLFKNHWCTDKLMCYPFPCQFATFKLITPDKIPSNTNNSTSILSRVIQILGTIYFFYHSHIEGNSRHSLCIFVKERYLDTQFTCHIVLSEYFFCFLSH
jgi:hypothetical protein